MTKFEEEASKNGGVCFKVLKDGKISYEIQGLTINPLKIFGDWHSDEEFQELKEEIQHLRDENTATAMYALSKEFIDKKPVIPQLVADLVEYVKQGNMIPSDIIEHFHFKNENFEGEELEIHFPANRFKLNELSEYFRLGHNRYDFERACIAGYEVEKPKEKLYKVRLKTSFSKEFLTIEPDKSFHFSIFSNDITPKCYMKQELAELADGAFYKAAITDDGFGGEAEWINPLIELIEVKDDA